jgi:predicted negative regulator of RcsB-dependent stress response
MLTMAQRWLEPVKRYWRHLAAGGAAVLLIWLGWVGYRAVQESREEKASQSLAQLKPQLGQPSPDAAQRLHQVAQAHAGSRAAQEAGLLRAHMLYHLQQYNDAAQAYEALLPGEDPAWETLLRESLSYCYEGLGDLKKAAETLKPLVETAPGPLQSDLRRRLAMLLDRAGAPQEAARYWRELLERSPDPVVAPYLKEKLAAAEAASQPQSKTETPK